MCIRDSHTANVNEAPLGIVLARLGIPNPAQQSLDRARSSLRGVMRRLLRQRQASNVVRDDLLSLLMAAQDTEGDGGKMSEEQIFDAVSYTHLDVYKRQV